MNEFPGQGHQPPDDPWTPARPAETPPPAAAPVPVRIIWAAGIRPPGGWRRPSGICSSRYRARVPAPTRCGSCSTTRRGACGTGTSRSPKRPVLCSIARTYPQIAVDNEGGGINVLLGRPRSSDMLVPARPARPGTIRVRIIWDAGIRPPVASGLGPEQRKLFLALSYVPIGGTSRAAAQFRFAAVR